MFSSTAYEAFYTYIGIYLHEISIKIITSQEVLMGILVLILGFNFLITIWRYFSRYMPGFLKSGRSLTIYSFFKIMACVMIGFSLLKVDAPSRVKNYKRMSWHTNSYIKSRFPSAEESYQVSFIFDLLSRSAEEVSRLGSVIIDKLFKKTNSELEAPAAFYKAVLYSGSITIDDKELRDKINVYTNNCFSKVLPLLGMAKKKNKIDEFFKQNGVVDQELQSILIQLEDGTNISCLELKNEVREHLWEYSKTKGAKFTRYHAKYGMPQIVAAEDQKNWIASSALVNHFLSQTENSLGTQKGAKVQGKLTNFFLGWHRFFSFDGFLTYTDPILGARDQVGAALTAQRAQKFSEYLQRAPHLKGMVRMLLIALFPWLVFFVIAGKWKVLVYWFAIYASVALWTPIWILLYHLMTSVALSTEVMAEFGKLSDGISLYGSQFITAKLYQFYAIYSWLQLIIGPLPTVILAYGMFTALLKDSEEARTPEPVSMAKDVGVSVATGGSPVKSTVKRI